MHPFLRIIVIGAVGLIVSVALAALSLVGRNSDLSVLALLAAGALASCVGFLTWAQGWIWGSGAARRRRFGESALIAIGGGLMALVGGLALGLLVILVRLFYLA